MFAKYALEGKTLIDTWFRAACETQDPTNGEDPPFGPKVFAAAMWAFTTGNSPYNDHLWGHGNVAPDSPHPTEYRLMWIQP